MGIVGVGVDALEVDRMKVALGRTPSLIGRLFTTAEQAYCTSRCGDLRYGGLAARFAAKEALAKALGTGVSGLAFRDIEVRNDPSGRPTISLAGAAARIATEQGVNRIHLSLTHTAELAVANVVLES